MNNKPHYDGYTESVPPGAPRWAHLHLWQMQPVRDVLLILIAIGLFAIAQKISIVTVPLMLAMLLAYLLEPVIRWLIARGVSRRIAVSGIIAGGLLFVIVPAAVALSVGVAQLAAFGAQTIENVRTVQEAQMAESPEQVEAIFENWRLRNNKEEFSPAWRWVYDHLLVSEDDASTPARDAMMAATDWLDRNQDEVAATAAAWGIGVFNGLLRAGGAAMGLGFMAFVTVFFFYFTATEWVRVKGFGRKLLPARNRDRVLDLVHKFDRVIAGFVRGRLTIAFIQAVVFSVGYFLIGVPGAFLLGPAVAILSIVPYLALVGLPVSVGLLWLEGHTGFRGEWWWVVGAPVAFYFLGQALDDYVFTPLVQGPNTGMDTPTILFATLAGGALFGVFGLLIAIPIAACLKILTQEVFWPRFKAWADGRADDPLPIE